MSDSDELPIVTYNGEIDALYVRLSRTPRAKRKYLDDDVRAVDYAADGAVVGVEFQDATRQLNLDGLPDVDTIEAALKKAGVIR